MIMDLLTKRTVIRFKTPQTTFDKQKKKAL